MSFRFVSSSCSWPVKPARRSCGGVVLWTVGSAAVTRVPNGSYLIDCRPVGVLVVEDRFVDRGWRVEILALLDPPGSVARIAQALDRRRPLLGDDRVEPACVCRILGVRRGDVAV